VNSSFSKIRKTAAATNAGVWMLTVDGGAEVCSNGGQRTCCSSAAERRLHQVAVEEGYDIVASATSSLRTLVTVNAVLFQRKSRQICEGATGCEGREGGIATAKFGWGHVALKRDLSLH